ncbi:MAG: hypothetical protein HC884_18280 [Chloroflexaceae bacterium]|nr:hypothetical protein [Chloroflexaceae bacterium]
MFRPVPLDRYAVQVTSGVAYLGGVLVLPLLFATFSGFRWPGLMIPTAFAAAIALFLLLAYAGQPTDYRIEAYHLVIRRRWLRAVRVPLGEITGVSLASMLANVPRMGLRFAFNPGIFGYQGPFDLVDYGRVFFLATNREHLVAVSRRDAPSLILSPARFHQFIEVLDEERRNPPPQVRSKG